MAEEDRQQLKGVEIQATAIVACWVAVCVIGVISNVIQTLLMTSKSERESSYSVYLTGLGIADSVVLLIKVSEGAYFLAILQTDAPVARTAWKAWTSSIVTAVNVSGQCLSAWILVAIAIDRIVVLCFPPQRLTMCSRQRALWVISFLVTVSLAIHVPLLGVYLHHVQDMNTTLALARSDIAIIVTNQVPFGACDAFSLWIIPAAILHALSSYLIPSTVLLLLCICLIYTLISRYQKLHLITITDRLTAERIKKQNQLAVTLLVLMFKFSLFGVPYSIVLLMFFLFPSSVTLLTENLEHVPKTAMTMAPRWLVLCSLEIIVLLSRASHVWVLFGDGYFRRILYQLVCADRTRMNASLTAMTVKRREIQKSLDEDISYMGNQVVGLRVSSNKSSFRQEVETNEMVTPDTIHTFEVDMDPAHLPDIRPTEIVLKETAKRLSIIVENSKL